MIHLVGEIISVLTNESQNEQAMLGLLVENGFPLTFPDDVLEDAARYPEGVDKEEIKNKLEEFLPPMFDNGSDKRLWDIYKSADLSKKKVLFIFDQFEEFTNHPKQERDNCISQLADLVSGYLPGYISQEMRKKFKTLIWNDLFE